MPKPKKPRPGSKRAQKTLKRIMPLDEWKARYNPSEAEVAMRQQIVEALEREAKSASPTVYVASKRDRQAFWQGVADDESASPGMRKKAAQLLARSRRARP